MALTASFSTYLILNPTNIGINKGLFPIIGIQRPRNPYPENHSKNINCVALILSLRNVTLSLNPITEITNYKQFISRALVNALTANKTTYDTNRPNL